MAKIILFIVFHFYFNKLYILKNQIFKAVFQERVVFRPLYLFLLNRKEEGNYR